MATAANQQPYVNPWGYGPLCGSTGIWNRQVVGRPPWIALMVLGFIFWWPVGLGLLLYMILTGRMGGSSYGRASEAEGRQGQGGGWNFWSGGGRGNGPSGNHAFDEYRAESLRRLEEEQQEFASFLERLRVAKDKAEFDQFMAERRRRTEPSAESGQT